MNGDPRPTLTATEEAAIIDYAEWSGIDPGEPYTLRKFRARKVHAP